MTFDSLTLTGGKTTTIDQDGGAIRSVSAGQLTIRNSTIGQLHHREQLRRWWHFGSRSADDHNSTISGNSTLGMLAGAAAFLPAMH